MPSDRRNTVFTSQQMRDQLESSVVGRLPPMPHQPGKYQVKADAGERAHTILVWIVAAQTLAIGSLLLTLVLR